MYMYFAQIHENSCWIPKKDKLFVEYVVHKMCGTTCLVGIRNPDTSCCRYIVKQLAMFEISKALGTSLKKTMVFD